MPFFRKSTSDSGDKAPSAVFIRRWVAGIRQRPSSTKRQRKQRVGSSGRLSRKPGSDSNPGFLADSPAGKSQQTLFSSSSTFSERTIRVPDYDAREKARDDGPRGPLSGGEWASGATSFPVLEVNVDRDETSTTAGVGDKEGDDDDDWEGWNDGRGMELPLNQARSPEGLYRTALQLAEAGEYDQALAVAREGINVATSSEAPDGDVVGSLIMLKANVLGHLGHYRESLDCYQSLLGSAERDESENTARLSPADRANVLYACGRLCASMADHSSAIDFYERELRATVGLVGGTNHPSVSRIHHQIAHVYKEGLGELSSSLEYLKLALKSETACLVSAERSRAECVDCTDGELCPAHDELLRHAQQQMHETKRRMGRIYYELGDLNQAIRLTLI